MKTYIPYILFFTLGFACGGWFNLWMTKKSLNEGINNTYVTNNVDSSTQNFHNSAYNYPKSGGIIHDTVPQYIDTNKVIQDYYDKHSYAQTFRDSSVEININDTVQKNLIVGRSIAYKNLRPTSITTITQAKIRNKLLAGMKYESQWDGKPLSFSPQIGLMTKRDWLYTLSVDPFNKKGDFSINYTLIGNGKRSNN